MKTPSYEFGLIQTEIAKAQRILIISHVGPDADTVGSNIALSLALREQAKKEVVSACFDAIPEKLQFLPESKNFVQDFDLKSFDLVIAVDVGAKHLLRFHETKPELLNGKTKVINIDHHYSNESFGTINVVLPDAPAAAMIVYELLKFSQYTITSKIATCLLAGIYYDTGGLKHSNTSQKVFKLASELVRMGANVSEISKNLFKTMPVNKMRLWGRVFENMYKTDQNVVMSVINDQDLIDTHTTREDLSGIIEYLNMVPNSKFSVMLSQDANGKVKGSLRTLQTDVDVSDVANKYGGGGHKQASGFVLNGKLEKEVRWKVVKEDGSQTVLEFDPNREKKIAEKTEKTASVSS